MFDGLVVYADRAQRAAAMNMAVDEALLRTVKVPVLRVYGWRARAVSFGYFGRYADVVRDHAQSELVRRWTGGGVVQHGTDLTYSIIIPSCHPSANATSHVLYSTIHGAIRRALPTHVDATLAAADEPKISDACFANPVKADVLSAGRKIAGAAQRRTRVGLLHQGSIQSSDLPANFIERFAGALIPSFRLVTESATVEELAREMAEQKYATAAWLQRV